jgi:predicted GNAT family N-acyltransferase
MKTLFYSDNDLPENLKIQILDFMRIEWPDGFRGDNLNRDWIDKPKNHPVHFVTTTDNHLAVSYVGVLWKELRHSEVGYITYGLSGVFTYPQFRGKKYGLDLVKQATEYITLKTDADIILFPSRLDGFYEKAGYEKMTGAILYEGLIDNPKKVSESLFMQFLSEKSKGHRQDFVDQPIYFGEDIW